MNLTGILLAESSIRKLPCCEGFWPDARMIEHQIDDVPGLKDDGSGATRKVGGDTAAQ